MKHALLLIVFLLIAPAYAYSGDIENGKKIYMKKCKGCHRLTEGNLVGPSLAGVTKRRSKEWLHRWLENPRKMIKDGDPIALELLAKYKKKMPTVKRMKLKENRDDLLYFLKSVDEN